MKSEIFKENPKQIVNKALAESQESSFVSEIEIDIDPESLVVFGIAKDLKEAGNITVHKTRQSIKWGYTLNLASWGINYLSPNILEQDIPIMYDIEGLDGNDQKDVETTIHIKNVEIEFMDFDTLGRSSVYLYPEELQFYKGKVTVIFTL